MCSCKSKLTAVYKLLNKMIPLSVNILKYWKKRLLMCGRIQTSYAMSLKSGKYPQKYSKQIKTCVW